MSMYWTHRPNQMQALFIQPCHEEIFSHAQPISITSIISSSRTATPAPCSSLCRRTTSFALSWRRSDEREVHFNLLIQQLGIVRSINRSSSLVQRWVFDKRIALEHHSLGFANPNPRLRKSLRDIPSHNPSCDPNSNADFLSLQSPQTCRSSPLRSLPRVRS